MRHAYLGLGVGKEAKACFFFYSYFEHTKKQKLLTGQTLYLPGVVTKMIKQGIVSYNNESPQIAVIFISLLKTEIFKIKGPGFPVAFCLW